MFDGKIVAACIADRKAYDKVQAHVDPKEFTPTGRFWWKHIQEWYGADSSATRVDESILRERGERSAGRSAGLALDWLETSLSQGVPSPENVALEVLELKRIIKWRELSAAHEAEWDREKLLELTDAHHELMHATSLRKMSDVRWGASLEELDHVVSSENKIRLWPAKVQEYTGGALRGHHIVVFGRPEIGKSLVAINNVVGWLREGHKVLYVGNEEGINTVQNRIRCCMLGATYEQIQANLGKANVHCRRRGWGNLYPVHLFPGSAQEIEEIIEEKRPDCLVVDQLRNLHTPTSKGGTKAQRLDDIACEVRQLLGKYEMVGMSIGQAHAQEHGHQKIFLDLDDFDESRTGVPGQADLMIGVGADVAMLANGQRGISLPKNKLSGRHEQFVVNVDTLRSTIS